MIQTATSERGSTLLIVVILTVMIGFMVASAVTNTLQHGRNSRHAVSQTDAMSIAEGVTNAAQKRMLDAVSSFAPPPLSGTVQVGGVDHSYAATALGSPITHIDVDGVTLAIQPYSITCQVTGADGSGSTITRVVHLTMTPIFQYMIFFDGDLEILPGPSMLLGGRVHSNADIYVGCGDTLTVDTDYFRCTGSIARRRKNNGSSTGGDVDIKHYDDSDYTEMTPSMDSSHEEWIDLALDTWGGTVQDGAHGVTEVSAPSIGSIKAFVAGGGKGYYHANADLVIVDGQAYDNDGDPIALPEGALEEKTFYDARQEEYITVTELDISILNASGQFPSNGLIYGYRTDATVDQANGFRLTNGSTLASAMTFVSEDPVYVHGDFNNVEPHVGAAVIADAVNLLSNAWDDSKSPGSLPTATPTQFNLAMISGNVPTPDGGGIYSGGFENMPRFHEKWSGVPATIRGSFVSLFESEVATAHWGKSDVYKPPIRDWQFDPLLQDPANMPPFTPNAVHFQRVVWDDNVPLPF